MKRLLLIALALMSLYHAAAQWDTVGMRLTSLKPVPLAASAALMGTGAVITFVPDADVVNLAVRDIVPTSVIATPHVEDYVQYLPMATPLVLNLCGLQSRHTTGRLLLLEGGSFLLGDGWLHALKRNLNVLRPDGTAYNSFPSGHTFTAFVGAEVLRREYGEEYPWLAVAGYAVATAVGALRIAHNRHWTADVLAGAGLAVLSVTFVYWALD